MEDAVTDARVNIKIELFCEARKAAWFNSTADSGEEAWQMKYLLGQALKAKWVARQTGMGDICVLLRFLTEMTSRECVLTSTLTEIEPFEKKWWEDQVLALLSPVTTEPV